MDGLGTVVLHSEPQTSCDGLFAYAWLREWHYLEVWPYWSRCVTVGLGFNTLVLAA